MMAYSTGGLNQKYTILFDNSASTESWWACRTIVYPQNNKFAPPTFTKLPTQTKSTPICQ
jgi:hypothetical protein